MDLHLETALQVADLLTIRLSLGKGISRTIFFKSISRGYLNLAKGPPTNDSKSSSFKTADRLCK